MNKDKIVIITGANSGIGKAATEKFAKEGYTVIMACRNLVTSKPIQEEIMRESGNNHVELMELDISSFYSIRKFCQAFQSKYEKLDILIHNAAYFNHGEKHRLSSDNIEITFATNVFGPFLMTELLLDSLKKSEDPRILHASSNIVKHFFDPKKEIQFNSLVGDWQANKSYSVYQMYSQSKMALVMLTFKMATMYQEYGIKVNALQINGAKMSKETLMKVRPAWRMIARIQNLYFPPTEKIATCYYEICTSDDYSKVTGKFFSDNMNIMQPGIENPGALVQVKQLTENSYYPRYAENEEKLEELWKLCRELTSDSDTTIFS